MDQDNKQSKSDCSTVSENQTQNNEVNADESKPSTSSPYKNMTGDDWTERYLQILAEPAFEPERISREERIRLIEEQERKVKEDYASRKFVLPVIKVEKIHLPPPKPPKENKEEDNVARLQEIEQRREEEVVAKNESLRQYHIEKEIFAKIVKDNRTRDHYWKPDPLFYVYLRQLGYPKIAIERALFVVDNKSASAAKEYMDQNPNCSELTKEEVIMEAEELLSKIRPKRRCIGEPYAADTEAEREIVEEIPPEEDVSFFLGSQDIDGITKMSVTGEDDERRRRKRKHDGELVEIASPLKLDKNVDVSSIAVEDSQYEMIFINNTSLALDAVTLSLESGKACVGLMDKLANGGNELKRMSEKWVEDGSSVRIYRGINNDHLFNIRKEVEKNGYTNYLSIRPSYRFIKTPSPTVLGIFGEQKRIQLITDHLEIMLPQVFKYLNVT